MRPCRVCGAPTTNEVELIGEDEPDADAPVDGKHAVCDSCFDQGNQAFEEIRRQFKFLTDNGVSEDKANEIMLERLRRAR